MGRSLSSIRAELRLFASLTNTLNDSVGVSVNHPNLNNKPTITSGLGSNQANRGWQSLNRSLANGAVEDLDLYDLASVDIGAGVGRDGVGQTIILQEIVAIAIINTNAITAAGELEIQPSAENGWTPIGSHTQANGASLKGQGVLFKAQYADTAFEVTDGASHRVKFTATGGSVTYSIYILGRSDTDESSSSSSSSISTSGSSSSQSTSSSSPSSSSWSSSSSSSSSSISTSSSSISTSSSSSSSSTSTSSQSSSSTSSSSVSTSSSSSSSS